MRIAFIVIGNSRRSNYLTGDTIRYGKGGGSGTDGSSILVAEYLASQGHEVVFAFDRLEPGLEKRYKEEGRDFIPGTKVRGVIYTYTDFQNIENLEFDILVNSLWFQDYSKMPIKVTKSVIYWCHMQWIYGIGELLEYTKSNNLTLGFVHISEWERSMNQGTVNNAINSYGDKVFTALIPNPIMDDIVKEVLNNPPVRKPYKFIFHASWARGGNVALEAVRQLPIPDKEFHAFDYLMTIHDHKDNFFFIHDGVDKKTLFQHLAESEYFVYPLYTPYQDVHKDTFSCVVAEAIALGAIPVTYPLGALPEYFNDYCKWVRFPSEADPQSMQKEALSKDLKGIFKENIPNLLQGVEELGTDEEFKNKVRTEGSNYIIERFSVNKVGQMWVDFLNKIT